MNEMYRMAKCCGTCKYFKGSWCEQLHIVPNEYAVCDFYWENPEMKQ